MCGIVPRPRFANPVTVLGPPLEPRHPDVMSGRKSNTTLTSSSPNNRPPPPSPPAWGLDILAHQRISPSCSYLPVNSYDFHPGPRIMLHETDVGVLLDIQYTTSTTSRKMSI
jgi:hypothetical protein